MATIEFCKFHGFGNDYIVVEEDDLTQVSDIGAVAKAMCHRHTGVGADGIAVVGPREEEDSDFHCRIFNPDGTEAGFSGNGTRCAVAYLYFKEIWTSDSLKLSTPSGNKEFSFKGRQGDAFSFVSRLGKPEFAAAKIPFSRDTVASDDPVVEFPIRLGVRKYEITCVNVGNPVCVIFTDNFEFNWRRIGRLLESEACFPERTNVVFVKVDSEDQVEIRIWERGAGDTSSSGTCAIAAAIASAYTGKTGREVNVVAPGGTTRTVWDEDDEMVIEGEAELAFCGQFSVLNRD
ncbi:MAG TPA: diaminopimelate epimerase [Aridibacter sp.]|nr:diaminopimelate epimerase [Aridibacter sp.]